MNDRLEKVRKQIEINELDQLIISDPYSIFYLTGVYNEPGERMYVLLLGKESGPLIVANRLFNVPEGDYETVFYSDTDNQIAILSQYLLTGATIGVDKDWPAKFLLPLMEKRKDLSFSLGSNCVDYIRSKKDNKEIEAMRIASKINDTVMEKALKEIREGITEKELASYIDRQYIEEGADGNSFTTIVSFGANAADPHHEPDNTVLKAGDVVLIDMGCIKDHYCSDMTRTVFYKSASEQNIHIHDLVRKANETAESIIKPGVRLCDIDFAARNIISEAGYGPYFNHRLGHFIGLSVHEKPDVSQSYNQPVEEGMIFSIEPGVYLKDDFGVRIEDLVVVTKDGCEVLNKVDKKWRIIK